MSIIVNLKESRRTSGTANGADLVSLQMDYITAHEDLAEAGLAFTALNKTAKDLEKAEEFTGAIAQKDPQLASVVAHEMVSLALANIGQDAYADEVAPAHEDITVTEEGIKDTMKNVWDKIKEYAKKVWNFIRNLIMKAVDFVKGIFGKNGSSADELKKLVEKLKKEKRTLLEEDEFDKATRERLAGKIPVVLITNDSKLTEGEYANFIDLMDSVSKTKTVLDDDSSESTPSDASGAKSTINNVLTTDGIEKFISKEVFGKEITDFIDKFKAVDDTSKEPWNTLSEIVEDKISDFEGGIYQLVGIKDNKATFLVLGVKSGYIDAMEELAKAAKETDNTKKYNAAKGKLSKVLSNFEVFSITVSPEKNDYMDKADNIIPLDYSALESLSKKLTDLSKKADKEADKIKSNVDKKAKRAEKAVDILTKTLEKAAGDNAEDKAAVGVFSILMQKTLSLVTNSAKITAQGKAETLLGIARNSIVDVCKESARLYKKEK